MRQPQHQRRRAVAYLTLAILLGVVALVLSQCTMVGDSLTGLSLEKNARSNCVTECNQIYEAAWAQAKKDCAGDEACLEAAHEVVLAQKRDCLNHCHKQGAGGGG